MQKFQTLISPAAPLLLDNIDTDQIIPARFLTATDKKGFGERLFMDLRFNEDGITPKPNFILNRPEYKKAKILLAGENFGCGSSREHAPWALFEYGFRAVVAISFADIFKNNALKNGLLPIALPRADINAIAAAVAADPATQIQIDLAAQTITWPGQSRAFDINPFAKKCLLEGLDDIGYTLSFEKDIAAYEKSHPNSIIS